MTDILKEQFKKLKEGAVGAPDQKWVEDFRSTLLMQVKNTVGSSPRPLSYLEKIREFGAALMPIHELKMATRTGSILLLVMGLVFGGSVTTVSASLNSVPGDLLYGLKRMSEEAQVRFADEDEAKAELHMEFAGRRVQEVAKITDSNSGDNVDRITEAVAGFKDEVATASQFLEDLKSEPERVVQVAKLIDAKSEMHQQILSAVEKKFPDSAALAQVQEAKAVSEDAGVKAVEAMVVTLSNASSTALTDEVKDSVTSKINDIEKHIGGMITATSTPVATQQAKTAIDAARDANSVGDFAEAITKIKESTELVRAVAAITVISASSTPASSGFATSTSVWTSSTYRDSIKVQAQTSGESSSTYAAQSLEEGRIDESSTTPRTIP